MRFKQHNCSSQSVVNTVQLLACSRAKLDYLAGLLHHGLGLHTLYETSMHMLRSHTTAQIRVHDPCRRCGIAANHLKSIEAASCKPSWCMLG